MPTLCLLHFLGIVTILVIYKLKASNQAFEYDDIPYKHRDTSSVIFFKLKVSSKFCITHTLLGNDQTRASVTPYIIAARSQHVFLFPLPLG